MLTKPGVLLRVEGVIVLALSIFLYRYFGGRWEPFALLFLVPDLSLLGYLLSIRFGAVLYNIVHTYAGPLALVGFAVYTENLLLYALIWTAHIGMDRLLGFGLKYPTRFQDTHLQRT